MKKQYKILAMMEGHGFDFFDSESAAMQMQVERVGQEAPESDLLSMINGAAVIEVKGKLTNKNSVYNKYYGLISYDQIREAVVEAVELGAGAILFDIDSPGGSVSGMKDLSNFIQGIDLPTVSHTSATEASAGYFLGSSCEKCYADDMAEVGSVGVVMTLMEYTEAMKKQGVHAEVFRSGKHKQAGNPYEKLSAENRKHMKDQVMTYANKFFSFVSENRGIPRPAMTEIETGKTFIGEEAVAAGLIDKITSFDEALVETIALAEKTLDTGNKNGNYPHSYSFNKGASAQGEPDMAKTFSKTHLEALVNAGKETPAPAPDASEEKTPEMTEEELAALALETEGKEAEGSDSDEQTGDDPAMVEAVELTEMTEKFDASQVELAESAEKLEKVENALVDAGAAHAESVKPMVEVICAQINTMRVALSLSSVDMKEWDAAAIMKEHASISKTFESSLPVGGVVPDEEGTERNSKIETRDDVNAINALGF